MIVLADSRGLVPELNRTSTELASTNPVQVTLPSADARQPGLGHDRRRPGRLLPAHRARRAGRRDLRRRSPRSRGASSTSATRASRPPARTWPPRPRRPRPPSRSSSPTPRPGRITSSLQGDTGSAGGQPFTLSAQTLPLQVTGVEPSPGGQLGHDHADHPGRRVHRRDDGQPGSARRRHARSPRRR